MQKELLELLGKGGELAMLIDVNNLLDLSDRLVKTIELSRLPREDNVYKIAKAGYLKVATERMEKIGEFRK